MFFRIIITTAALSFAGCISPVAQPPGGSDADTAADVGADGSTDSGAGDSDTGISEPGLRIEGPAELPALGTARYQLVRVLGTTQTEEIEADDWAIAAEGVAEVGSDGNVTTVSPGMFELVATLEGESVSRDVTVSFEPKQITVGRDFVCLRTGLGAVYCWGSSEFGQLGDGKKNDRAELALVEPPHDYSDVAAGGSHVCGLIDGEARCWGRNQAQQLGDGTDDDRPRPRAVKSPPEKFVAIAPGGNHTCAIGQSGTAYCWGSNAKGQLGIGESGAPMGVPKEVGEVSSFERISTGMVHTCGISGGKVHCWGDGTTGKIGTGGSLDSAVPSLVTLSGNATQIAAGNLHTCAATDDSDIYCWGSNSAKQLGTDQGGGATPVPIDDPDDVMIVSMKTLWNTTCAKTHDDYVGCWGPNPGGVRGYPVGSEPVAPNIVQGDRQYVSFDIGVDTACGVTTTGEVVCWGSNDSNELGPGAGVTESDLPIVIELPWSDTK